MKRSVFVLLLLLCHFSLVAADEGGKAHPRLKTLFQEQIELFTRKPKLRNLSGDVAVDPVTSARLAEIHREIMKIPCILSDWMYGCEKRTHAIQQILAREKVWNQVGFLGIIRPKHKKHSPFAFGPGRGWQWHWVNLVAVAGEGGQVTLMSIDPVGLMKGPAPLSTWFNELTEGDRLYNRDDRLAYMYGPAEQETPNPPAVPDEVLLLAIQPDLPELGQKKTTDPQRSAAARR